MIAVDVAFVLGYKKLTSAVSARIHISDTDIADSEIEEEIRISKVKKFEFAPMTVEEAIMQMNLLSHEFFMFRNAETGVFNLVYKRKENDYGLIEPKE